MNPWLSDTLLRAQSDERLVALTRAGHERAFAAIVERYRRPLVAFARRVAPDSRAEDVVQQALLSAWAALAAGAEVAHLRGWLHQIVRHEAIRAARHEGLAFLDPLAAAGDAGAGAEGVAGPAYGVRDTAAAAEERERLRAALDGIAELPVRQREALVQTTLAGRSRGEVAAALGLSEGAVRQLVHRARTALRTAVTAITPPPLVKWAASVPAGAGQGVAELAAGAKAATVAAMLTKAGAVVVATGAIATGVTVTRERGDRAARLEPAAVRPAHGASTAGSGGGAGTRATPIPRIAAQGAGGRAVERADLGARAGAGERRGGDRRDEARSTSGGSAPPDRGDVGDDGGGRGRGRGHGRGRGRGGDVRAPRPAAPARGRGRGGQGAAGTPRGDAGGAGDGGRSGGTGRGGRDAPAGGTGAADAPGEADAPGAAGVAGGGGAVTPRAGERGDAREERPPVAPATPPRATPPAGAGSAPEDAAGGG